MPGGQAVKQQGLTARAHRSSFLVRSGCGGGRQALTGWLTRRADSAWLGVGHGAAGGALIQGSRMGEEGEEEEEEEEEEAGFGSIKEVQKEEEEEEEEEACCHRWRGRDGLG
jgi:hypothetical protein